MAALPACYGAEVWRWDAHQTLELYEGGGGM